MMGLRKKIKWSLRTMMTKKSLQTRAFHQEKKKKPSIRRCTKPTTMSPNSKKEKTKELRRIKYQEKKKENEQIKTKEKIATLETELKQERNDDQCFDPRVQEHICIGVKRARTDFSREKYCEMKNEEKYNQYRNGNDSDEF